MTALPAHPDVIVVGAGTAGLSTAQALMERGLEVAVLEAAGHAGGRCVTDTTLFQTPFDKGGSWLHSAAINPLARRAEALNVPLHKEDWLNRHAFTRGVTLSPSDVQDYEVCYDQMWAAIAAAGQTEPDCTAAEAVPQSRWRELALHWVAQMQGGDADQVSARDIASYSDAQGDWLVDGGLGAFVQSLFAGVPVQLNCPVSRIDRTGPGVTVTTPLGLLRADHVVVTVSTGVLAAEFLRFDPPLPDAKLGAIAQLPNGILNKVGIEMDARWQDAHHGHIVDYHAGDDMFCTLLFGFYKSPLGVGFTAGRCADALEAEGPGAATAFCREAMRAIFGSDVTRSINHTAETAWRGNPLTRGAYSFARPGGAGARRVLAEPLDGQVFFAGEATMSDAYATVHGAYLSGIRAAKEVVRARG